MSQTAETIKPKSFAGWLALPLALLVPLVGAACGEDARETTDLVTPEAGGSLTLDEATVEFPPGSLIAETTVTLRRRSVADLAALLGSAGDALTIEPADTVLERAATLTFELGGAAAAPTLHRWNGADWIPQPTERLEDDRAQIAITELGSFALAIAEDPVGGNRIDGVLRWSDGSPVAGANPSLGQAGRILTTGSTDEAGRFAFTDLSPGAYQITLDFECQLSADVTVTAEAPTAVDLTLCGS